MGKPVPVRDRLMAKVQIADNGCWNFTGAHSATYGQIWWNRRQWLAHRVSYAIHVGPIPEGKQIDHKCRNRSCVNPDHLEPVTAWENANRAGMPAGTRQRSKTHCPEGHPYDEANTYVVPKSGHRQCRTCNKRRSAAR
ncbi:HNH endonuclease signature motif containing protein [Micromonospora sp. WMMD754]|uniref:HNH endonuclease signature motif containing protein n=1 Tax=Micromonospora sp. WMMD754 TaxID=3404114 RepID=UPI003BF5ECA1